MLKSETMYSMGFVNEQKAKRLVGVCWEVFSHSHIRTLALGPLEGSCEQGLHGVVVEKDTA